VQFTFVSAIYLVQAAAGAICILIGAEVGHYEIAEKEHPQKLMIMRRRWWVE
jgi:hypothetical protein